LEFYGGTMTKKEAEEAVAGLQRNGFTVVPTR
jgi:hypothetical protein